MLKKEIKTYKQGNREVQKININKQDKLNGIVYILTPTEYNEFQNTIKQLKYERNELSNNFNKLEDNKKTINEIIEKYNKTIKELDQQQHENITNLDKTHKHQLKQSQDQYNKQLEKYINLFHVYISAFEKISELGLLDIIQNKHKKIAKDQIKELKEDKKVYELTEKKK